MSVVGDGHFEIDDKKIAADALRRQVGIDDGYGSSDGPGSEIQAAHFSRDDFRDMKSVLETRPIFHKCDEVISVYASGRKVVAQGLCGRGRSVTSHA